MLNFILNSISAVATWGTSVGYFLTGGYAFLVPTILKNTENGYEAVFSEINKKSVKEVFPELSDKIGKVGDNTLFMRKSFQDFAYAFGANFIPSVIVYDEDFYQSDQQAAQWVLKHEISHIKGNDIPISYAFGLIASSVSAYALPYIQSCLPRWISPVTYLLPSIVGSITAKKASLIGEIKADRFANLTATNEELLGGERFFVALTELNKELHQQNPKIFSKEGNCLKDYTHPLLTDRLEEIRKELKKRDVPSQDFSEESITKKVQSLKDNQRSRLERTKLFTGVSLSEIKKQDQENSNDKSEQSKSKKMKNDVNLTKFNIFNNFVIVQNSNNTNDNTKRFTPND